MTDEGTRILSREDCSLAYRAQGAGEPILFIQGVGVHGDGWRPQVDAFASSFRCITFDHRGIGESAALNARNLPFDSMVEDAFAVLDAENAERAHVVGHSMGGLIALRMALRAPERVRSLALLCSFAHGGVPLGFSWRMAWLGIRSRVGTRSMRRAAFLEIVLSESELAGRDRAALAEELKPLFGHDLADSPAAAMKQLFSMRGIDCRGELSRLAGLPALVLAAEHDPIAPPPQARAMANAIPGVRFVEIAGASHGVPLTRPDAVNAELRELFARGR